jgi:hypothetical protein
VVRSSISKRLPATYLLFVVARCPVLPAAWLHWSHKATPRHTKRPAEIAQPSAAGLHAGLHKSGPGGHCALATVLAGLSP